jgi:hypothetical protein
MDALVRACVMQRVSIPSEHHMAKCDCRHASTTDGEMGECPSDSGAVRLDNAVYDGESTFV